MIMKTKAILLGTAALMFTLTSEKAIAQIGTPYIHDPSTIMECDGKYYTFGTGGGGLISEDGWTWNGGGVRPGGRCRENRRPLPGCLQCHGRRPRRRTQRQSIDHVE